MLQQGASHLSDTSAFDGVLRVVDEVEINVVDADLVQRSSDERGREKEERRR